MSGSAVDRAYEWLRDGIVAGRLETGNFIDEATVCDATGVSRTPVREAFHRLAGEQYIDLVPRRGAQVRSLGAKEMYEVFSARWALESQAVQELCMRRSPVPVGMRTALQQMIDFPSFETTDERVEYGRLDRAFHRAYVEAIGNSLILRLYDSMRALHERAGLTQVSVALDDIRRITTEQHLAILAGLEAHDLDATLSVLRDHLSPIPEVRMYLPA